MDRLSFWISKSGWIAALGIAAWACNGDDDSAPPTQTPAHIEITGSWVNAAFGEKDTIDDESWSVDFGTGATVASIVEFSNSERYAIRKSPEDAAFTPGQFDRVVWTKPEGDHFYYCIVTYGCETAALTKTGVVDAGGGGASGAGGAGATPTDCTLATVDASDPEHGGCGDFTWTKLTAE